VKISLVDSEIIWLKLKTEEITEGKIYSPVDKSAKRTKLLSTTSPGTMSQRKLYHQINNLRMCLVKGLQLENKPCKVLQLEHT